ncbi:MAG TPA: hypothetical protein VIP56_14445 [Nitrososphaeraceae archaeon]
MEKTTTNMTVVLTLAFGLILGSIGSAGLAHAQQQANTTATGSNMTGKATGPGAATNATKSPSSVGGGNMTSPTAKTANQTASTQSPGGNNSMAGGGSTAGSGNATQSGNQTMTAAKQQSANQTGNNTGNPLAKIPIIGKIFGGK